MKAFCTLALCALLALALSLGFCETGEAAEAADETAQIPEYVFMLTEAEVEANKYRIYEFLTLELGFNHASACGVMANIDVESRFDPTAVGDYGTSYGLCQWHNKRYDRLIEWSAENDLDYTTLEAQLLYMKYELDNNFAYVFKRMTNDIVNTSRGAYSAGNYWCINYQRPKDKVKRGDARGELARQKYFSGFIPIFSEDH